MPYPDSVPVLEPHHFRTGASHDPRPSCQCHCLMEWANIVFCPKKVEKLKDWFELDSDLGIPKRALKALSSAAEKRLKYRNLPRGLRTDIIAANDNGSPAESAKIWNEAMEALGYVEIVD